MSASHDPSGKVSFVYSNLYSIYSKRKPKAETKAVTSLKENLKSLNDLHARLRFMLTELEELVKK